MPGSRTFWLCLALLFGPAAVGLAVGTSGTSSGSRGGQYRADLRALDHAVQLFRLDKGRFPTDLGELSPRYIEAEGPPLDPFGEPYVYLRRSGPEDYLLLSRGGAEMGMIWGGREVRPAPTPVPVPSPSPSGLDRMAFFVPVVSAGLAAVLGLTVWFINTLPMWRSAALSARHRLRIALRARARARPSAPPVQCAFCHGDDPAPLLPCPGCATALHAECWGIALRCPTLGCRLPAPRGATSPPGAGADTIPVVAIDVSEPLTWREVAGGTAW